MRVIICRQHVRTVTNVDIVGSSKCHTRHLATGGVARFNYVLVTNSIPVTTCASDGRVNPYPKGILYGGVSLSKFPIFLKKAFSMRGVYLTFGGVTNIPPWSDFENLARFLKSDPYVHLGGIYEHFTSDATYAPFPPAHSRSLILSETRIHPNATPTTIRRSQQGGRQQGHGEKAIGGMKATRRKPAII